MHFPTPLIRAKFLRREKRFFIYAELPCGTPIVAHTPNTGSMRGILDERDGAAPIAHLWLTDHGDPALTTPKGKKPRSLRYTLEIVEQAAPDGTTTLIGTHTGRTNGLAAEALVGGLLPAYTGWHVRPEAKYDAGTRFDFLLTHEETGAKVWTEVKHVSLRWTKESIAFGAFPDSVTERGAKHLKHLAAIATDAHTTGTQALQLYITQREDITHFCPAESIDPAYATALRAFRQAGGTIMAFNCAFPRDEATGAPTGIMVDKPLEIVL